MSVLKTGLLWDYGTVMGTGLSCILDCPENRIFLGQQSNIFPFFPSSRYSWDCPVPFNGVKKVSGLSQEILRFFQDKFLRLLRNSWDSPRTSCSFSGRASRIPKLRHEVSYMAIHYSRCIIFYV
jgi:hypothetical protein